MVSRTGWMIFEWPFVNHWITQLFKLLDGMTKCHHRVGVGLFKSITFWLEPRLDNQEMAVKIFQNGEIRWHNIHNIHNIHYITLHYITYHTIPYHTIPYQSFPQLRIRPSSNSGRSLGTHRKVSDTNPPACTPHRRLKRSKSPRARFVETAWQPQLPGPDVRLCKSSWSANCSANRSKKCFAFGFFGGSYSMVANMLCLPSWPFWNHVICLSNINTDKINKFIALQK